MLYDWDGEINDAFIAYRNAAVAYQQNHDLLEVEIPPTLGRDLERVGRRLGFRDELDELHQTCPDVFRSGTIRPRGLPLTREDYEKAAGWRPGNGEVVLPARDGLRAPERPRSGSTFPSSRARPTTIPTTGPGRSTRHGQHAGAGHGGARSSTGSRWPRPSWTTCSPVPSPASRWCRWPTAWCPSAPHARVENLARQARLTFDAEKPTIFFKTILRGLTKYLASKGAEKAGGQWAGLAANIFGAVTESADTRSWLTLPEHVHLARLSLPPGTSTTCGSRSSDHAGRDPCPRRPSPG